MSALVITDPLNTFGPSIAYRAVPSPTPPKIGKGSYAVFGPIVQSEREAIQAWHYGLSLAFAKSYGSKSARKRASNFAASHSNLVEAAFLAKRRRNDVLAELAELYEAHEAERVKTLAAPTAPALPALQKKAEPSPAPEPAAALLAPKPMAATVRRPVEVVVVKRRQFKGPMR